MKKNFLIIASHYPPSPKAGAVIRVAKLVKYLPENGWNPIIITSRLPDGDYANDELLKEVAHIGHIHRLPQFDLRRLFAKFCSNQIINLIRINKINARSECHQNISGALTDAPISSRIFIPDYLFIWSFLAILRALPVIIFQDVKVIFATSPLQSSLLAALILKLIFRIPLIVELRDPWTTNPFAIKKCFNILSIIENSIENRVFQSAEKIIVINEHFIQPILKKYPYIESNKFYVLPNGYDDDDLINLTPIHQQYKTIVHAGSFYAGRSPLSFLKAFANIVNSNKDVRDCWKLKFVGSGKEFDAYIKDLGIFDSVIQIGQVSHSEALTHIISSDLLILLPGVGIGTMTGKIFEYVAAKKPILVLAEKENSAASFVSNLKVGMCAPIDNIDQIENKLLFMISNLASFNPNLSQASYALFPYQRRELARMCASLMDIISSH